MAVFSSIMVEGKLVTINWDGRQTRENIYVDDVTTVNLAGILARGNLTINVVTGIKTYVLTLHAQLRRVSGSDLPSRYGPAKLGEQQRRLISPRLARELLGWEPSIELLEGLRLTYQSIA